MGSTFGFNYTWAHFLSSQDSAGWGTRGGVATYQNAYVPSANYGNSNFDIAGQLKGDVIYQLPFGQGQRFVNNNQIADYAIGGWRVSAIIIAEGGNPMTPVMNPNSSYELASGASQYPNLVGNPKSGGGSIKSWFNQAAYASPGADFWQCAEKQSARPWILRDQYVPGQVVPYLARVQHGIPRRCHQRLQPSELGTT